MKNLLPLFLLFGLLASSFVSAEDRTGDPNDINVPIVGSSGTDDNWQVNLASQDRLTNEDFNIEIKAQPTDQDDNDFDDYNDSDDDNDDNVVISGASFGDVRKEGFGKTADGDFDLDLIRKEILRKARDDQDFDYTNDDDSTDADLTPQPERVDDDLRPDNGKISTQVVSTDDDNNEIEDSDDGDDADIVDDQDDSHGDDVDDDYQQDDDSAMADDDYVNDPDAANDDLADEVDYANDNDDDSDSDDSDDFLAQDFIKNSPFNSVNLQRIRLNMTTIDISPLDSDDTDDDLDDVYYNADDDDDSDYYDIYDSKYREEAEKGGLGVDESNYSSSDDYDIFIDIDDSAWAALLTEERKQ